MDSVEAVVTQIQGLFGGSGDISLLHSLWKQADDLLHNESTRLAPFLEQLDPPIHTLGYLYLLEACTSTPIPKEQANQLVLSIANFINNCSTEQIHSATDKFVSLCKWLKDQVILLETPMRSVAPMLTAVRKLQSASELLTALHPDFLLLCLLAKCYKTGPCILKDDIFEVDQPRDFFLYCYYGGMICIGQKRFCKALELLLEHAPSPPATTKFAIVNLGKMGGARGLMHPQAQHALKQTAMGMAIGGSSQAIYDGGFQNVATNPTTTIINVAANAT